MNKKLSWTNAGKYEDIKYQKMDGIAKITINRPQVRNAFRPQTVEEMSHALNDARMDEKIGVVVLTGEGKDAFWRVGKRDGRYLPTALTMCLWSLLIMLMLQQPMQ